MSRHTSVCDSVIERDKCPLFTAMTNLDLVFGPLINPGNLLRYENSVLQKIPNTKVGFIFSCLWVSRLYIPWMDIVELDSMAPKGFAFLHSWN